MNDKNLFRKNLVAARKKLGLTQEMLAKRMNVSPQAVSSGKIQVIPIRNCSLFWQRH